MIKINGSSGEGGGQILRTALSLSLVTGQAFEIVNIRAGRKKPGLLRQHLTAVEAARAVGSAKVKGNEIHSASLSFSPGKVLAGDYKFSVGTAGSTTLIAQTVLPALMLADKPSHLILEGGTHNPFAPTFDFFHHVFTPFVHQCGVGIESTLHQPGFYPAGGGKWEMTVTPAKHLKPMQCVEHSRNIDMKAKILISQLSRDIALREKEVIQKDLSLAEDAIEIIEIQNSIGPGNVVMVEIRNENITEMVTTFGELGKSAENVASEATAQVQKYLRCSVPVGSYLADQLLIPLALSGQGEFLTMPLSRHALTNIDIIHQFLDAEIKVKNLSDQQVIVSV